MDKKFPKNTFGKRMSSMLRTDSRRMFMTPLFYIMLGIVVVMPIVMLVMTGMMEGSPVTDPQTQLPMLDENGNQVLREGFDNVWQIIGSTAADAMPDMSAGMAGMEMDMTSMCNMDLLFFGIAVLICLFVSGDFKSGYSKNLFTVRAKKTDYVISKIVVGFVAAAILVVGFFLGAIVGGAISGTSFAMDGFNAGNMVMCMLSKIFLMAIFVAIYVMAGVIAKQRTWLGMVISFAVAMLLFAMIPMITPLDATFMNVALCLVGGAMFSVGLGAVSRLILQKTDIL